MLANSLEAATGHRVDAGIDKRHNPRLCGTAMDGRNITAKVDSEIRAKQVVVRKVFLDEVALIPEADDEFVDAVRRIHLHDMPQDWTTADFDHRFRAKLSLLGEASTQTTRQYHSLSDHSLP